MDFINRIIGLGLVFIMLVLAPSINMMQSSEVSMKREIMNEVTNLIDKVTDTGQLTDIQRADFYLAMASHGVIVDANISRLVKVINPDGAGGVYTTYTLAERTDIYNEGDFIKVDIEVIGYTGAQKIIWAILKFISPQIDFSLSGRVRK